jgi:flagellin
MSLVINHNMMAMNTARNLNNTYGRLNSSVERLSSGLRINSAADDAAGLAIRELMRADITTMQQGIRNAADAISMIQTADGAMAVIDEKLTRMKELAEQAATGTYTTLQREIINSEYQAMAAEIDRIATSTNFNGVKLLDGTITNLHGGLGMKIHFGVGNSADEDYYFINTGDVRATSNTGLRIGGDAKNDIWGQGAAGAAGLAGPGCCTAGYDSLDGNAGFKSGQTFSYGYNWDWTEDDDPDLLNGRYLAGRYTVTSSESLQDLINKVNEGTQSRVGIKLNSEDLAAAVKNLGTAAVCIGNEAYVFGSASVAGGTVIIPAVSGVVNRTVATGTYAGEDFVFNNVGGVGKGFALTQAQIKLLEDAGLDLSAMNLTSAMVSASGASLVNSAQAKTQLLVRLTQAWQNLNLDELSGLSVTSGLTSGFSITSATLRASAGSALVGTGLNATVSAGETLKVHTGVYADENGNWTDSARIASALGLEEVIIEITNQDTTQFRAEMDTGNTYKSPTFKTGNFGGTSYAISAAALSGKNGANLYDQLKFPVGSASVAAFAQVADTQADAEAAFYDAVRTQWLAKYTGMTQLDFEQSGGTGLAGPTSGHLYNSAAAITNALSGANNTSGSLHSGYGITIHTGIYADSAGNFTTDANIVNLFQGGVFEELVYRVANSSTTDLHITLQGQQAGTIATTGDDSSFADIEVVLTNAIRAEITARQGNATLGKGAQGEIRYNPDHPTNPSPPLDWAELAAHGASVNSVSPPSTLTTNITVAGVTTTLTAGELAVLPKTTTLDDLILAVSQGLSTHLTDLNTAGTAAGLKGLGRIVTDPATPPYGPTGLAQVYDQSVVESFYSGTLDRSVATGTYYNSGDIYSSTKGYALTSAQLAVLAKAGLDLTNLNYASAIISASASSTVSSAEARANLLAKISELWSALNMASMSAIAVSVGVSVGFDPLTIARLTASAEVGDLNGVGAVATVNQQESFVVHTGVYADAKGNWTDDKALASALGLQEIIYTVENNNYTPIKASATFSTTAWWTASGDYTFDLNNKTLMSAAGLDIARLSSTKLSFSASAATSAAALAKLYSDGQTLWNNKYGLMDLVIFSKGATGATIPVMEPAEIQGSDPTNAAALQGAGPLDQILSGQVITVNTGIYIDGKGNWTDDAQLASAFGLSALVYKVTENTGNYTVAITYGDTNPQTYTPQGGEMFYSTYSAKGLEQLGSDINASIKQIIEKFQAGNADSGRVARAGQIAPPAPTIAQLAQPSVTSYIAQPKINTANPSGVAGNLDITVTLAGSPVLVSFAPKPDTLNMGQLLDAINIDLAGVLSFAQDAAEGSGLEAGKLNKIASSVHQGPTLESQIPELKWEDIYKEASGPKTVTTTGIVDKTKFVYQVASAGTDYFNASGISNFGAWALASAINHNANSQFWAMVQPFDSQGNSADMVYVFTKLGGDYNSLLACDVADGDLASRDALKAIQFENVAGNVINESGTSFSLGGEHWGTFKPIQTKAGMGKEVWNLTIHGQDVGKERDMWIAALSDGKNEITTPGLNAGIINGLDRHSFVEIQNAANGQWSGAEVRTQSSAQEALEAVNGAMERKDKVRADIGALQNRLENTITNLEIQMEALQASESRISDVDVATEMTEFVRNQVLAQAAVSMLSQANSLPQMALSLLNG